MASWLFRRFTVRYAPQRNRMRTISRERESISAAANDAEGISGAIPRGPRSGVLGDPGCRDFGGDNLWSDFLSDAQLPRFAQNRGKRSADSLGGTGRACP